MERKQKKKIKLLLLLILLLLVIAALLTILLLRKPDPAKSTTRDGNASPGQYEGKTDEEIQKELNRVVEEGMFNISINPELNLENGASEADLRIENVPSNSYLMKVQISLDDTGEIVYTSGIIEPNYHIQSAPLDIPLKKGIYTATAVFTALDPETESASGTAAAKITIRVNN